MGDATEIHALSQPNVHSDGFTQFKSKDFLYLLDQNSGQYGNNQLIYSTAATSNNNQFVIWSEAYLAIPITVTCTDDGTHPGQFSLAWKNGFHNLIDSAQIVLNGVTLNNQNRGKNILTTFHMLTETSADRLKTLGPTAMFFPDSADTAVTTLATTTATNVNNIVTYAAPDVTTLQPNTWNEGLFKRAVWGTNAVNHAGVSAATYNATNAVQARNYWSIATNTETWHFLATIRLADIHDVFKQLDMPLKNTNWQLYFNLNMMNGTVATGLTNPIMLTDVASTHITAALGCAMSVVGPTRLYYPVVTLEPEVERSLIGSSWKKTISYWDYQWFQNTTCTAGNTFSWTVSNGVQNLKRLIFIPFSAPLTTTLQSYKGTEPGTCSPQAVLGNISLMLNGKNFYSNSISYDYQEFIHNVESETANGGHDSCIASGLIDFYAWSNSYRYYVFNVSRNPSITAPDVPVSIQLNATNSSPYDVDVVCLAEYESAFTIDQSSGQTVVVKSLAKN